MCAKYKSKAQKKREDLEIKKLENKNELFEEKIKEIKKVNWIDRLKKGGFLLTIVGVITGIIYLIINLPQKDGFYFVKIYENVL